MFSDNRQYGCPAVRIPGRMTDGRTSEFPDVRMVEFLHGQVFSCPSFWPPMGQACYVFTRAAKRASDRADRHSYILLGIRYDISVNK